MHLFGFYVPYQILYISSDIINPIRFYTHRLIFYVSSDILAPSDTLAPSELINLMYSIYLFFSYLPLCNSSDSMYLIGFRVIHPIICPPLISSFSSDLIFSLLIYLTHRIVFCPLYTFPAHPGFFPVFMLKTSFFSYSDDFYFFWWSQSHSFIWSIWSHSSYWSHSFMDSLVL
jgi:hypothetical protein